MSRFSPEQYKAVCSLLGLKTNRSLSRNSGFYHCPFHKDKTPSFSVNFSTGIYHCFSCNAKGTLNSLAYQLRGVDILTLLGLKGTTSFTSPFMTKSLYVEEEKPKIYSVDVRGVIIPFERSVEAKDYLIKRRISFSIAKQMEIGYMDDGYINGTHFYKRLTIPIKNKDGKLTCIEGRDITFTQRAKVIYPKNTRKSLYQLDILDKNKSLFIVEGLMDLAILRSDPFFANSTCMMGMSPAMDVMTQLNDFEEVILIPDNDEAGNKSCEFFLKNIKTKFVIWKIQDYKIKDVGEIPIKTELSIMQFREKNLFKKIYSRFTF